MSKDEKPRRLKIIYNPSAGDVSKGREQLEEVKRHFADLGVKVDVSTARPKKKAIPLARKAVKAGYDTIVAMGGDGTIGVVIRGMADSKARLGIIPTGTSNDIASSLGIPTDLRLACELIAGGHTRKVDLGVASTKERTDFYFFSIVAVGLTAAVYPLIKEIPDGKFTGLRAALTTFFKFESKPVVQLTLDDESQIEVETMLVTVTNTPLVGMRHLVAPQASLEDGLLDVAVYPNFNKAQALAYFAHPGDGKPVEDARIQRYRARKIKIKSSPKLDVAAESMLLGKGTVKIKVLPSKLRVIAAEVGAGVEKPLEESLSADLPAPVVSMAE